MQNEIDKQYTTYKFSKVLAAFLGKTWIDVYARTTFGRDDYKDLINRRVYEKVSTVSTGAARVVRS